MTKRKLLEEVAEYFLTRKYILKSCEYKNSSEKLIIEDEIGYKYSISFSHFKSAEKLCTFEKYSPEKFSKNNLYTFENIKLWIEINDKNFCLCGGYYTNNREDTLNFRCFICGEVWNTSWDDIYTKGCACPYCSGKRIGNKNNLLYCYPKICLEWDFDKNELPPEMYTSKSAKYAWWICSDCGNKWKEKIKNRTISGNGCPACNQSKGEKKISEFLYKYEIFFIREYKFEKCRNKRKLPFDFYIPSICCIEYQGEQHYRPIEFFGGEEVYKLTKMRDGIKKDFCIKENIDLITIPYWNFDKIEEILEKEVLPLSERR